MFALGSAGQSDLVPFFPRKYGQHQFSFYVIQLIFKGILQQYVVVRYLT